MPKKICMFVRNPCTYDPRVLKAAQTLARAGFEVEVIARHVDTTKQTERRGDFKIIRVPINPMIFKFRVPFLRLPTLFKFFNRIIFLHIRRLVILKKFLLDIHHSIIIPYFPNQKVMSRIIIKLVVRVTKLVLPIFLKVRTNIQPLIQLENRINRRLATVTAIRPLLVFRALLNFINALDVVKKNPADIYHAHDLDTLAVAYLAKKKFGGKLIYDSHEFYTEIDGLKHLKRSLALAERFLIRFADQVITVNDFIAQELKKRYKIKLPAVILNTPHYYRKKPSNIIRKKLNISQLTPLIVYSGGISPNRGIEEIVKAMKYLKNYHLVFLVGYGQPEYLEEIKTRIKIARVTKRIHFFGPVPPKEVVKYLSGGNLGVLPFQNVSMNHYLCSPNKLFEYIQAGLPIAGSNFPFLKQIIEGNHIGYTFDETNPRDIAMTIKKILENSKRYRKMRENVKKATKIYNWENESKKLLDVYRSLGCKIPETIPMRLKDQSIKEVSFSKN